MEELDVVASPGVGRARVWTDARKRISGVKMVSCIMIFAVLV